MASPTEMSPMLGAAVLGIAALWHSNLSLRGVREARVLHRFGAVWSRAIGTPAPTDARRFSSLCLILGAAGLAPAVAGII